jgi:hypothetical protein
MYLLNAEPIAAAWNVFFAFERYYMGDFECWLTLTSLKVSGHLSMVDLHVASRVYQ